MHFFTDPSIISLPINSQYFGPRIVVTLPDPENGGIQDYFYFSDVFNVTTIFELTAQAKVFACQDSMMIVQEYIDSDTGVVNNDLVNIILKPIKGLDIPYTPVKYYIYRGVLKSSFISGSLITPNEPSSKSEFITKFWKSWTDYKDFLGSPSLPDPTPQSFGFGTLPNTTLIEEIYNSSESNNIEINDFQAIKVSEGEWIGNFGVNNIGFEIVVDTENFPVNLEYVKKSNHKIDVTPLLNVTPVTAVSKFNLKVKREEVLNFIDPVAFFGMHYEIGVSSSTFSGTTKNTINLKQGVLFSEILSKFYNKECFYLDFRSERGFSYNFYNNYNDDQDVNIKLTRISDSVSQETHLKYEIGSGGFPIIISRPSMEYISPDYIKKVLIIKLRTDDNLEPLLFLENTKLLGTSNKTNFVEKNDLIDTANPGWTKEIRFEVPIVTVGSVEQNLPYYLKVQYFRQKENIASPNTVLKNTNYLDSIFGGININTFSVPTVFNHVRNTKRGFIKGTNFDYVSETGLYFDDNRVLLYANSSYSHKESKTVYPKIDLTAFNFTPIVNSSVMLKEILFNKWQVEAPASLIIDILEIVGYNQNTQRSTNTENVYLLGITKIEFDSLRNNTGINNLHQRYIAFEEVINQQDVVTGTPYKKYKLKLQGLNDSGEVVSITPTTDVFVYGSSSNMLCSKDFATAAILPNVLPDPGTFEEFPLVQDWKYDETDSIVTSIFPNGEVLVADRTLIPMPSREVRLRANVFYPVDSIGDILPSTKKADYPLAVIIHGNGHKYQDYDALCTHLAKNGFIAISLSCLYKENKFKLNPVVFTYSGVIYDYVFNNTSEIFIYSSSSKTIIKYEETLGVITITPMSWVEGVGMDFVITTVAGTPNEIIFNDFFNVQNINIVGRSNLLYPHLRVMKARFGAKVQNNIGLIGHSRGGEAVVRAAKDILTLPPSIVPPDLKNINAIISLAPTDLWDEENLIQNIPYFVLYGSKDGDVSGMITRRQAGPNKISGSGGFSLYDRAINTKEKTMAFVYGATHNGFITDNHDYFDTSVVLEPEANQQVISKAYVNAFFRMHLKSEIIWKSIFSENRRPGSVPTKDIYLQYTSPDKVVISNFNGISSSSFTSLISHDLGFIVKKTEFNLRGTWPPSDFTKREDPYSPHFLDGMYVEVPISGGKLSVNIPSSKKDVTAYTHLSFRICYISGKYKNSPRDLDVVLHTSYNDLSDLSIELKDTSTTIKNVKTTKKIPFPDKRKNVTMSNWEDNENLTKSAFITIRIPLTEFIGVDLSNLKEISFVFPSLPSKVYLNIDDIEFTQ